MSLLTHRIGLTINVLFLAAGCSSQLFEAAIYRVAVITIVLMLHMLWTKAMIWRAMRAAFDENLDDAESVLVAERNRRIARRTT